MKVTAVLNLGETKDNLFWKKGVHFDDCLNEEKD